MVNEDEGISIPAVPRPIPRPMTRPAPSESEIPEAPSPGRMERMSPRPKYDKPLPKAEHHPLHSAPPLFIKIDRYQEVVDSIQKLKSLALGLRDALDALADIEKELTTGINIAHKALDDFNTIISMLDSKMTRVGEIGTGRSNAESSEINTYVRGIYDQMDKIKRELKNVSEEI
jgi:hypothetical protein